MQISKSKNVEDVGHMEEKLLEMDRELSRIRDKEWMIRSQLEAKTHMAKEVVIGKREPICHHGKPLHGCTPV